MLNIPVLKQDLKINGKYLLTVFAGQLFSLLLAAGICEMKLIQISDIFWDTIPVIIFPLALQMILAWSLIVRCRQEGTMDFILSTQISPEKLIGAKILFLTGGTAVLMGISVLLGCAAEVYSLTGVWSRETYLLLNMGGFCLQIFWGGFCFLIAVLAKKTSFYLKLAVGIPVLQYLLYLGYFLVPELFFLKYVTVFTLFDHTLFSGNSFLLWLVSALYLVFGIVFFCIGRHHFLKREYSE